MAELPKSSALLALHIGAHKTGTSHLQRAFYDAKDALAAHPVRFLGPRFFRGSGREIAHRFDLDGKGEVGTDPKQVLAAIAGDARRLVFSEENFIGVLRNPAIHDLGHPYPLAPDRVSAFAQAIGEKVDLFLGIRHPTGYWNSAYCQLLLGGKAMPPSRFMQICPVSLIDWAGLVTRLRRVDGVGQITVWRYEDYPAVFDQVTAAMVGAEAARCLNPHANRLNMRMSAKAVDALLTGTDGLTGAQLRRFFPSGETFPAFDAFGADDHAVADAAYDRQCQQIDRIEGVTLLRPVASRP